MSDPPRRETRPSRPYGYEPGARPRGRDPGIPPGAPRTLAAGARTPPRDPGGAGGWGDSRGSDPGGRDSGWGGRDSGPRGAGGNGKDPGSPAAGRGGDPGSDAPTRRMPAQPGTARPPRAQPNATRAAMTPPRGPGDGGARGPDVPRDSRGPRNTSQPRRPGGLGRWGALQGGLGVCIIVASAAIGATLTMVARSAPGFLLGLLVVVGTVAAALAVRPRTGWMIFPVPVLSYLVAALVSGVVFDRSVDSSNTALAVAAAQWIADGFFAMALATVLAVVIIVARWFLWRRRRPSPRDPGWPAPATGPTRTGPGRAGTVQPGAGRDGAPRPPRAAWETSSESGSPAGFAGPGSPREARRPRGPGIWGDPGSRGTGPRPGSEPYNFSSGA